MSVLDKLSEAARDGQGSTLMINKSEAELLWKETKSRLSDLDKFLSADGNFTIFGVPLKIEPQEVADFKEICRLLNWECTIRDGNDRFNQMQNYWFIQIKRRVRERIITYVQPVSVSAFKERATWPWIIQQVVTKDTFG